MIVCFLICIVVINQTNAYLFEKRFLNEQERMMQLDSLLQTAIHEFKAEALEPSKGGEKIYSFSYGHGTVTIEVLNNYDDFSEVIVKATLKTGHSRSGGFLYHWGTASIENYWEVSRNAA